MLAGGHPLARHGAFAERLTGGLYLDIVPDRARLARYGLAVGELQDVIAGALGCQPVPAEPIDDVDSAVVSHDGVWMYFNFTAERVAWSTGDAMTDPATLHR